MRFAMNWVWRWKDRIDRRFMERFARLPALMGRRQGVDSAAMACRGCAAKLPAQPLEAALRRLAGTATAPPPQDAAPVLDPPDGGVLLQSVDGFPALVADPWLNGRLTTLHACSDLWASGAAVHSLQAVVTLPQADGSVDLTYIEKVAREIGNGPTYRHFRLDRIRKAHLMASSFKRDPDFDLRAHAARAHPAGAASGARCHRAGALRGRVRGACEGVSVLLPAAPPAPHDLRGGVAHAD